MKKAATVDEYLEWQTPASKKLLKTIRSIIKKNAPKAEETISYGIPAYKLNGKPLVYYAAFKQHIGFYATPSGQNAFSEKLKTYKQGKGSVQFPLDQPLPVDLIEHMVQFKVQEVNEKQATKKNK